jgi:hypothetical protein
VPRAIRDALEYLRKLVFYLDVEQNAGRADLGALADELPLAKRLIDGAIEELDESDD